MNIPRQEHPNPQWERANWENLNGEWEFDFDFGQSATERELYKKGNLSKKIIVPFCPESELSGIGYTDFIPAVCYRKKINLSAENVSGNVFLHIGAVDFHSFVYINGQLANEHIGGFASFEVDITTLVKAGENEIFVIAEDDVRNGRQAGSYTSIGEPILGGTVMKLSKEDGTIDDAYIYYYEYEPADGDSTEESEIKVNGLQVSTGDLYPATGMQVEAVELNGANTYKLTPTTRCKFYVNTELIKNKNVFKFSAFLPESSTSLCVKSQGEFALRVKPNNIEPVIDGTTDGYIIFSSKSTNDKVNFVHGEWKIFEIDISSLGTSCTEFAFDFADNVIYLKDIAVR